MYFSHSSCDFCSVIFSYENDNYTRIKRSISLNYSEALSLNNILAFESQDSHWASISDTSFQQYFTIEFEHKFIFRITNYTILSRSFVGVCMRGWNLYGSTDGVFWNAIHGVVNSSDIECTRIRTFDVNLENYSYSFYRIHMTKMTKGDYHMRITNFEIYGYLINHSETKCRHFNFLLPIYS